MFRQAEKTLYMNVQPRSASFGPKNLKLELAMIQDYLLHKDKKFYPSCRRDIHEGVPSCKNVFDPCSARSISILSIYSSKRKNLCNLFADGVVRDSALLFAEKILIKFDSNPFIQWRHTGCLSFRHKPIRIELIIDLKYCLFFYIVVCLLLSCTLEKKLREVSQRGIDFNRWERIFMLTIHLLYLLPVSE